MKQPTALGVYIFAGGFTLGVRKHFDVLAHFEDGPYGVNTAQHNLMRNEKPLPCFIDKASWPVADYAGKVDFVYGNPPCAPWSVCSAGRAVPWHLDPRTGCAQKLFSLLDELQPKVWAWESVRPAFTKGREMVDTFVRDANARGYHATALMVEGTRHGVPQKRPRFILVLSKISIAWEPTGITKVPTVGEAFAKKFKTFTCTNEGSKFFLDLVRKTKPGKRVAALFNELYPERVAEAEASGEWCRGRPSFQNIRLDPNQPSCTLTGGAKQIHPTEHRLISIEESAALCGYPRDFIFQGSIGKQYQQVAQAVMPPVGEYLARMVRQAFEARGAKVKTPSFEKVEIFGDRIERVPLRADSTPTDWAEQEGVKGELIVKEKEVAKKGNGYAVPAGPTVSAGSVVNVTASGVSKIPVSVLKRIGTYVDDFRWDETLKQLLYVGKSGKQQELPLAEPAPTKRSKAEAKANVFVCDECGETNHAHTAKCSKNKRAKRLSKLDSPVPAPTKKETRQKMLDAAAAEADVKPKKNNQRVQSPPNPVAGRPAGSARPGSGARIRELLAKGWDTSRILTTIHQEFPGSKAGPSDVSWNKRKMALDAANAA